MEYLEMTNADLARKAGGTAYTNRHVEGSAFAFGPEALDRYTALVEARLVAKLLEGAGEKPVARTMRYIGNDSYAKEHGNCARTYDELPDGTYKDTWEKINELYTRDQIAAAVLRERQECAELCEDTQQEYEPYTGAPHNLAYTCAEAIRNRGRNGI
jgi:hypothetical protein